MRETIVARELFSLAAIEALEAALEARCSWIKAAVSPFAVASRSALRSETLPHRPALLAHRTDRLEELRLAG